jgi:mono/diheme cytochrome c family protein
LFEVNCARCHTPLWPARGEQPQDTGGVVVVEPGAAGAGRYGPALNEVSLTRLFPDVNDHVDMVRKGLNDNEPYGTGPRLGGYGMPGFGQVLSDAQILAIVQYERSLEQQDDPTYGEPPMTEAEGQS